MEQRQEESTQGPAPVERSLVQFDDHCPSRLDRTTKRKTDVTLDIERNCSARLHM